MFYNVMSLEYLGYVYYVCLKTFKKHECVYILRNSKKNENCELFADFVLSIVNIIF